MLDSIRVLAESTALRTRTLLVVILLGFAAAIAEGVGIGLLIPLIDAVLGGSAATSPGMIRGLLAVLPFEPEGRTGLFAICAAIIALILLRTVLLVANIAYVSNVSSSLALSLRVQSARQLLHVGFDYFARADKGKLLSTLDTHSYRASEAMVLIGNLLINACATIVWVGMLLAISWQMTLVVVAAVVPSLLLVRKFSRQSNAAGEALAHAYSVLASRAVELIGTMRAVRIFGNEQAEEARYRAAAAELSKHFARSEILVNSLAPVAEVLFVPAFLAVFVFALVGGIDLPVVLAYLLLLYRLQPSLKRIDHARVALANLKPSVLEVVELLRTDDKPYLADGSIPFEKLTDRVSLRDVSFAYPGVSDKAVSHVSFEISQGSFVALAGPSGAGKSTITNLLCRLYDPTEGAIFVDGLALCDLELASWRRRIAFAGQDSDLLDGTIRQNLAFAAPTATEERMVRALSLAQAADFVAALPQGLDTAIGVRGQLLSGGQRQRIALARALLREPDLLVLDEATSEVDTPTDLAILSALKGLAGTMTIMLISHREHATEVADRVIALEGGRVDCLTAR